MVNIPWPEKLKPSAFGFYHIDVDTSGGAALGGGEQFVISPGPRWGAAMTLPIFDHDGVLAARALRSKLKGRANPALLPNFDGARLSWPVDPLTGVVITPRVAKRRDGTLGLGGTSYGGVEIPPEAEIVATMFAPGLTGETQVRIEMTQGGPIREGQQFGLLGERLYEIADIVSVAGTLTIVNVLPRLRSNVDAGTAVQFTRPLCLMRCVNMDNELRKLDMLRFATLNLEFVEFF